MEETNSYATLAAVNVNEHKAQKGEFSYLSWADAVDVLQQNYPGASWVVREWDGLPFTHTPAGGWVCVTVTVGGLYRTQWHPILDHKNKVIPADKLDVFAVNKSIQRCLAKAIALHGLGLYIFRGEDLPADDSVETHENPPPGPAPKAGSGGGGGGATYPRKCPKCQGPMWDNRGSKKSPNQPDAKCKKKRDQCDGAIWEPKQEVGEVSNPPPGPAQNSTPSQSSSRPSGSGSGQPVAKATSDADRKAQDEAVALAVSLGVAVEDLNAFCEANMSRIPLFDMAGGALVNLTGKIESGVVEQWALAQTGGAG